MSRQRRVLYGVTAALTVRSFLTGQLGAVSKAGHQVHLLVGEPGNEELAVREGARLHTVNLPRNPSPLDDVRGALAVIGVVHRVRPDVTIMGTPKMALIGTAAAWACRVPRRVYVLHGLRAEGANGWVQRALFAFEHLVMLMSTDVVAVSPSLRQRALSKHLVKGDKIRVLGDGSANGIDLQRFAPATAEARRLARSRFGIPQDSVVVGQVSRICRDKGLALLPSVARGLIDLDDNVHVCLVGPIEVTTKAENNDLAELAAMERVHLINHVEDVEAVYAALDIAMLLTIREGMPTVALEAAACALPTVATRATGTVDAVEDGVTGQLVEYDAISVVTAVSTLVRSPERRAHEGAAGRRRIVERFDQAVVWARWLEFLHEVVPAKIAASGRP